MWKNVFISTCQVHKLLWSVVEDIWNVDACLPSWQCGSQEEKGREFWFGNYSGSLFLYLVSKKLIFLYLVFKLIF